MLKPLVPDHKTRVPSESNDPMYKCNPQGFPRLVWEEIEFIMLPDRMLQLFQWERTLRELWLDEYGNPKSFDARFVERYRRTGPDTIEGELTIYDPRNFTAPWTHPKGTFRRMPLKDVTFFEWKGLFSGVTEAICAPINEIDDFNERFRDPAINGK